MEAPEPQDHLKKIQEVASGPLAALKLPGL